MARELTAAIERQFADGAAIAADFTVVMPPGTLVVLFGPSGAGKTTVVRTIAGLDRPQRGRIAFDGMTWSDTEARIFVPPQQRRIGCVFQESALFPHLTVRANVSYGLSGLGRGTRAALAEESLLLVDLVDRADSYPRQLSGGQAQRAALARALAPHPQLLLLDEPFSALDTPTRVRMQRLLRASIQRIGTAALLVTHDRNEAIALGDQMVVIADGRVRQVGPVLDVFRRPADLIVARSVGVDAVLPALVEHEEQGLVDLRVGAATVRAVDAGIDRREVFACIRAEDVMLARAAPAGASARNHLPGRVVSIDAEGPLERVTVDCGFPLPALITRQARQELELEPGSLVVAAVKAAAIHLVSRA